MQLARGIEILPCEALRLRAVVECAVRPPEEDVDGHAGDDARGVVVELLDERGEAFLVEGGVANGWV